MQARSFLLHLIWPLILLTGGSAFGQSKMPSDSSYRLGPDDVFDVAVLRHPEYSGEYIVPVDGVVEVIAIGKVQVTGRSLSELSTIITNGLKKRLKEPEAFVYLKLGRSRKVYVVGDVTMPGGYESLPTWHIVEAIAAAGGASDKIDLPDITVTLFHKGGSFHQDVPLSKVLAGDPTANLPIEPGDVVNVQTLVNVRVYVTGQVKTPGEYNLHQKLSGVLAAIADAGGLTDQASSSKIQILHLDGTEETVDLSPILVNGAPTPTPNLLDGDLVVVPTLTNRVVILGLVKAPGVYPLPDGHQYTLTEVIGMALGHDTKRARLGKVGLIRIVDGKSRKMVINVARFIQKGDPADNPLILPGTSSMCRKRIPSIGIRRSVGWRASRSGTGKSSPRRRRPRKSGFMRLAPCLWCGGLSRRSARMNNHIRLRSCA
jgi:polysaccharide export outer membrane protein